MLTFDDLLEAAQGAPPPHRFGRSSAPRRHFHEDLSLRAPHRPGETIRWMKDSGQVLYVQMPFIGESTPG